MLPDALAWAPHVYSLELRKILSYRTDFWLQFVGVVGAEMLIAWFLWGAVFAARGQAELGGYSFPAMMLYFLFFALFERMMRGQESGGTLAKEIYDGSLTRYLVYPVPFFVYRFTGQLAFISICLGQFALAFGAFWAIWGLPGDVAITPASVAMALSAVLGGAYLFFAMTSVLELFAFWNDSVWSLLVMLRFVVSMGGGGLVPLSLYPERVQAALNWLPFHLLVSFPIRTIFGRVGPAEWAQGMALIGLWSTLFTGLALWIWSRGSREYSGVGA